MIFYEIIDFLYCLNIIYNVCMFDINNILYVLYLKGKVMNIKG